MDVGSRSGAEYYDQQAEAAAWHGPAIVFGLMVLHIRDDGMFGFTVVDRKRGIA